MKKIVTLLSFCAAILSGQAQMGVSADTVYIELQDGQFVDGIFTISNMGTSDIDVKWEILSNTVDPNYAQQFCDCFGCYSNEFAPLPDSGDCSFSSGQAQEWKVQIDPNGNTPGEGVFTLKVTDETNGVSDTVSVITMAPNSVRDLNGISGVSVYPNPAVDQVTVRMAEAQAAEVIIADLKGSVLTTQRINGTTPINIEALQSGVYFISVKMGDSVSTSRFVKQ